MYVDHTKLYKRHASPTVYYIDYACNAILLWGLSFLWYLWAERAVKNVVASGCLLAFGGTPRSLMREGLGERGFLFALRSPLWARPELSLSDWVMAMLHVVD